MKRKKKQSEEEIMKELSDKYGCDGDCYGKYSGYICGGVDTCEETRHAEGLATLAVVCLFLLFILATIVIAPIVLLVKWIIPLFVG